MHRFRWVAVVAVIAVLIAGTIAFAQGPGGGRRGGGGPGGPGFAPGVELRGLDLSDTQRSQIREIVQRYQQQMQSEIMLVLTPEQQTKAKALQAEREARMKQRLEQRQQKQNP
jgi:Spy/CpxP family protein refolding chaperone